jgi:hypothetical protein
MEAPSRWCNRSGAPHPDMPSHQPFEIKDSSLLPPEWTGGPWQLRAPPDISERPGTSRWPPFTSWCILAFVEQSARPNAMPLGISLIALALGVVALVLAVLAFTRTTPPVPATASSTGGTFSAASASGTNQSSQSASVGYDGPAICAPTTDAAMSGGSPATLMHAATEVANGTIEGKQWSLWSADGQSGAAGLEDGGLVFDSQEYGLCPGYPNPSETEMIDTGGDAIIYGVVNYPGLAKVQVSTGSINSFAVGTVLPSPHVQVVSGISFYIGTLPQSACSYSSFEINTTSSNYSTQHNIGFGENGVGQGYSITNNPGNVGSCVAGKLDPLSYSQGTWQLPPGQFNQNG